MTIQLHSVQEEQLAEMSAANGMNVDELARQAVDQFLAYRHGLEAAVRDGRAAAERAELLDHADVVARIQRLLV